MNFEQFDYLWAENSKWMLMSGDKGYLIVGYNEKDELISLEIEDDNLNELVIQKMLDKGVKVLDKEEKEELFKKQLSPEGFETLANPSSILKIAQDVLKDDEE